MALSCCNVYLISFLLKYNSIENGTKSEFSSSVFHQVKTVGASDMDITSTHIEKHNIAFTPGEVPHAPHHCLVSARG